MKQTGNLVSQYLENISSKILEEHADIIKKYVNKRHGIYALYKNNKLYYVGLASNLRNRLRHHLKDRHANRWDSFSIYLIVGEKHLHELEALLLRVITKKGNKQKGKFKKAEDLKKQLSCDLKNKQKVEYNRILGKNSCVVRNRVDEKYKKEQGRNPILAQYTSKRFQIRFKYKGKLYIAYVRQNGTITFDQRSSKVKDSKNKIYTSPSSAASAVANGRLNGWINWKYERAPGDWVLLDELRMK
ncbi:MAG: GIY-YIG nuclease family protein [Elusimicrobiota bacterium]